MINALILAAGRSSRMGSDKALLPINQASFIEHIIKKLDQVAAEIFVVLGKNFERIQFFLSELDIPCHLVKNEHSEKEMFSSIQKGLRSVPKNDPVLLHMIDQPSIPLQIYKKLIQRYSGKELFIQPSFQNKAGHPLLLSPKFIDIILSKSVGSNLKNVINEFSAERKFVNVFDDSILENINTREKYLRIKEKYERSIY